VEKGAVEGAVAADYPLRRRVAAAGATGRGSGERRQRGGLSAPGASGGRGTGRSVCRVMLGERPERGVAAVDGRVRLASGRRHGTEAGARVRGHPEGAVVRPSDPMASAGEGWRVGLLVVAQSVWREVGRSGRSERSPGGERRGGRPLRLGGLRGEAAGGMRLSGGSPVTGVGARLPIGALVGGL
jgi:hypothetical protein